MDVRFKNIYLENLYKGVKVSGKPKYNKEIVEAFKKKVDMMTQLSDLNEMRLVGGLNFEALKGDKQGLYSVRINDKYRLEFSIEQDALIMLKIIYIEELSNHYREDMKKYENKIPGNERLCSDVLLHPGEILGEELEVRKISIKNFAKVINVTPEYIRELIDGRHDVSPVMAIKLESGLQIPDYLWMRFQAAYDLKLARRELKAFLV
ncbi:MAG: HigA family addiction module antidote protein [Chitinophagaceae bacterium]|nr:HigA family addiction module antidote protein [Chitinophagaceae bacterium]